MSDLRGVFPPVPTPFAEVSHEVDLALLERHLHWLGDEGADGVVALGTTGEFPSLSLAERREIVRFVLRERGPLEVLVNATATNLPEVLELAREAADGGALGVLVMPPFYFRSAPLEGFVDYFQRVLDRSPLPVLLYHFPANSGVDLGRDGLAALAAHPNLVGVKDSGTKIDSVLAFLEHRGLRVFVGNDHLVEEGWARGAHGVISVCSNVLPGLVRRIATSAAAGGEPDLLQKLLSRFRLIVEKHRGLVAVKAILEFRGLCRGVVRPPLLPLGDREKGELREAVEAFAASLHASHGAAPRERS